MMQPGAYCPPGLVSFLGFVEKPTLVTARPHSSIVLMGVYGVVHVSVSAIAGVVVVKVIVDVVVVVMAVDVVEAVTGRVYGTVGNGLKTVVYIGGRVAFRVVVVVADVVVVVAVVVDEVTASVLQSTKPASHAAPLAL